MWVLQLTMGWVFTICPTRNTQILICRDWELDTILQETGNCYLYEKMGYYQTGKTEKVID